MTESFCWFIIDGLRGDNIMSDKCRMHDSEDCLVCDINKQFNIEENTFNKYCYSICPDKFYCDENNEWFFAVNGTVDDCDILTNAAPFLDINQMAPVLDKIIKTQNVNPCFSLGKYSLKNAVRMYIASTIPTI
jgi:hypothetical protein